MYIAKSKAKMRGSLPIIWICGWIESLPHHGLGFFDLVISTGVLHHLKSPHEGLKMLNDIQLENGGAEFLVYGQFGRTGVYHIHSLMRHINHQVQSMSEEIYYANVILEILPWKHWFHHSKTSDSSAMGNIGIYDLLLHKRDVSYSIPELYNWLKNSGYSLVGFAIHEDEMKLSLKHLKLNALKSLFKKLINTGIHKQQTIGEIISGNILKQDVYVCNSRGGKENTKSK